MNISSIRAGSAGSAVRGSSSGRIVNGHSRHGEFHRVSKDLKRTQMFMRHRSITTTADTYMHLDRQDLEEAMNLAYVRWQELTAEEEAD
jgi:integrase